MIHLLDVNALLALAFDRHDHHVRVLRLLRQKLWRVIRIWEHALTAKHAIRTMARLIRVLGE